MVGGEVCLWGWALTDSNNLLTVVFYGLIWPVYSPVDFISRTPKKHAIQSYVNPQYAFRVQRAQGRGSILLQSRVLIKFDGGIIAAD